VAGLAIPVEFVLILNNVVASEPILKAFPTYNPKYPLLPSHIR